MTINVWFLYLEKFRECFEDILDMFRLFRMQKSIKYVDGEVACFYSATELKNNLFR